MPQPSAGHPSRLVLAGGALLTLTLLLLYLLGAFGDKVQPGAVERQTPKTAANGVTVAVEKRTVDDVLAWPGTVRSRTVTAIAPKLTARILEIKAEAGDRVKKGDVIVLLDQRDLKALEQEANAALAAARAEAARAVAEEKRTRNLYAKEAATRQSLETAVARSGSAQAEADRAANALIQAKVHLDETKLLAPFDGVVVKRLREPGDMGLPGQPVVILQDPVGLRLEAYVPAGCAAGVRIGMEATARIDAAGYPLAGRIDEIEPEADPATRTVLVKLAMPDAEGLQPGLFGWLEQACESHEALLIPEQAVRRIGQIETVRVAVGGEARLRHIRTGKRFDGKIEALSGLREGESVILEQQ